MSSDMAKEEDSFKRVPAISWQTLSRISVEQLRLLTTHGKNRRAMSNPLENGTERAKVNPDKHAMATPDPNDTKPPPVILYGEGEHAPERGFFFISTRGGNRLEWDEHERFTSPVQTVEIEIGPMFRG
jgi:hypothetical protein